jgi:hypothetical protein
VNPSKVDGCEAVEIAIEAAEEMPEYANKWENEDVRLEGEARSDTHQDRTSREAEETANEAIEQ